MAKKKSQSSIWSGMAQESFFKPSTNVIGNYCVLDSGNIPRMILALNWSQNDNKIVQHLSD